MYRETVAKVTELKYAERSRLTVYGSAWKESV